MTEQDALAVLSRLRAGIDITTVVSQVRDRDLLIQLSLVLEIRRRYDVLYISGIPLYLIVIDNPYLDLLLY